MRKEIYGAAALVLAVWASTAAASESDKVEIRTLSNRADLINNPAGQISGMLTKKRPAKEIVMSMVRGAEESIERLATMRK